MHFFLYSERLSIIILQAIFMYKTLFSLLLLTLPALAAAEVYVVDVQKVLSESSPGKKAKASLEKKFKASKDDLEAQKKSLIQMQQDAKKQSSLLSEEALQKKIISIREKEQQVGAKLQKYRADFAKENNDKLGKIMKAIQDVTADIAKENNYSLVIEKSQVSVLYAEGKFDLTDEVIKKVNSKNINF